MSSTTFREDYENAEDIGHGVLIARMRNADGKLEFLAMHHPGCGHANEGYSCIPVSNPKTDRSWLLVSEEPLTISPSVLCLECGHHGHIRDGKWVP